MELFGELLIWLVSWIGECMYENRDIEVRPWWLRLLAWTAFVAFIFGALFLYLHLSLIWGK